MRILVVGGTRFVGRYLVAAAAASGHEVTVLHRGTTCAGAPDAEHLHADRDAELSVLGDSRWDATIDICAYWPAQVESLADALGDRGGRHVLISTVSTYADLSERGLAEDAPLQPALGLDGSRPQVTPETYGGLKVGCEQVAAHRYGSDLLIIRPTYVVGPHDHTGRFPAWVRRAARGGQILAPGSPEAPLQWLDARDLGAFVVDQVERGEAGIIHTMAPSSTWNAMLTTLIDTLAPEPTSATWVAADWLEQEGVTGRDLPLWVGTEDGDPVFTLDPARALAAGLRVRPLAATAADTWEWLRDPALADPPPELGLEPQRESELLARWHSR